MSRSSDDNNEMFVDEGPSLFSNQDSIEKEDKKSQISSSLCVSVLCQGSFMSRGSKEEKQQQEQIELDKAKIASLETENANLKTQMADILTRLSALENN